MLKLEIAVVFIEISIFVKHSDRVRFWDCLGLRSFRFYSQVSFVAPFKLIVSIKYNYQF